LLVFLGIPAVLTQWHTVATICHYNIIVSILLVVSC